MCLNCFFIEINTTAFLRLALFDIFRAIELQTFNSNSVNSRSKSKLIQIKRQKTLYYYG